MNDVQLERFLSRIEQGENQDDCWKWNGRKDKCGYGQFSINEKRYLAHRVSYEYHNNCKIQEGMCILHSCDNPECANPKHLREGTHQDNVNDKVSRNRQGKKLTKDIVLEIRNKYSQGNIIQPILANQYNVSRHTISEIIKRKTWKHI